MKPLSRLFVLACALTLALGLVGPLVGKAHAATLIYADEFNGPLDSSVWKVKTPFNTNYVTGELEWYDPANVSFVNGNLRILTERRAVNGYNYASAMITSLSRPQFSYGYFESRFNMPTGKGIWPAFWLTNDRTQEIDMMELIGEDPYHLYMTYHKGGQQVFQKAFSNGTDLTTGYHTIGMDWQPTYIKWYVDGQLAATYTGSIPSDPMWLIFNTAVGGAWPADPDSSTPLPQNFDIDYVRVYDHKPDATTTPPADTTTPPAPTPDPTPAPAPAPAARSNVYRFYNPRTGTHFYTASDAERDAVIAAGGSYVYEGVAYSLDPAKNAWPLYRFYNPSAGTHFYTASRTERDKVIDTLAGVYTYEGIAYNVSRTADAGPAVFRFYNARTGGHFYTASTQERDAVIANFSQTYTYEGPVFYLGQ